MLDINPLSDIYPANTSPIANVAFSFFCFLCCVRAFQVDVIPLTYFCFCCWHFQCDKEIFAQTNVLRFPPFFFFQEFYNPLFILCYISIKLIKAAVPKHLLSFLVPWLTSVVLSCTELIDNINTSCTELIEALQCISPQEEKCSFFKHYTSRFLLCQTMPTLMETSKLMIQYTI